MNRNPFFPLWLVLAVSVAWHANAGDFIDTRLSFVISENNFFAGPGETPINSPGLIIDPGAAGIQFFDNYDTRYSGFETLSHLVLYSKLPSFFDNLTTEASLVVRLETVSEHVTNLYDAGSYLRLSYAFSNDSNLELVMFPISGDRFRLGYSYKISWGGSNLFTLNSGLVPAAKLQLNYPWGYGFVGFKATQIREHLENSQQTENVANYGVLGGLGVEFLGFRVEANGGYFNRGAYAMTGLTGEAIHARGVSYQLSYHKGMEIGTSIDFKLYENDPDREFNFFKPEKYDGKLSFMIKHEGSYLVHTLADFEQFATTVEQPAAAFDLNVAIKSGYFRAHLDAMYRSLSFMLVNVPSFVPFYDFPDAVETSPEYFIALGVDYHFPKLHLTPGIKFGVRKPATYTVENFASGGLLFLGKRSVVVNESNQQAGEFQRYSLPAGQEVELIWAVKANCRMDLSESFAVIAELYYSWDNNQVKYISDDTGINFIQFVEPKVLGLNVAAQARF